VRVSNHVGALEDLAEAWDAPVFAQDLETPYLDGRAAYPPPDPSVGGGLMARLSGLFRRGPVNVGTRLKTHPPDGSTPFMPEWRWLHTPGRTPGHVSFWREADRALIVGDAFVITRQESVYAAATQAPEMHGPRMYYTTDWDQARNSVGDLAALEPELVITGHGRPLRDADMRGALRQLAKNFDDVAVPEHGGYKKASARADDGTAFPHLAVRLARSRRPAAYLRV
jgi:glyoxylase-like metal-dependent hydrolase (beta-lactamase superfamily II)